MLRCSSGRNLMIALVLEGSVFLAYRLLYSRFQVIGSKYVDFWLFYYKKKKKKDHCDMSRTLR
jgi:hypothetical protein